MTSLLTSGQRDSIACFDSALITPHSSESGRANWQFAWFSRKIASKESRQSGQFALPSRRDFHSFSASRRDMLNSSIEWRGFARKMRAGLIFFLEQFLSAASYLIIER